MNTGAAADRRGPRPRAVGVPPCRAAWRCGSTGGRCRRSSSSRRVASTRSVRSPWRPGDHELVFHPAEAPTVAGDVIGNGDRRRVVVCARRVELDRAGRAAVTRAVRLPGFLGRRRRALSRPRRAPSRRATTRTTSGVCSPSTSRALDGLRILKTDLWDEAKNTRILAWASRQGARAYGIDISEPTVIQARAAFDAGPRRRCAAPSATCATCPSATPASMRSTRWARSSTSTKPSAPSKRWRACSSPAGAPSSACRTGTIRFCGRCSPRCSRRSGSTATATRSPTHGAR